MVGRTGGTKHPRPCLQLANESFVALPRRTRKGLGSRESSEVFVKLLSLDCDFRMATESFLAKGETRYCLRGALIYRGHLSIRSFVPGFQGDCKRQGLRAGEQSERQEETSSSRQRQ